MAQSPPATRENFKERHEVKAEGWFSNKGTNIIETEFERNYYLTDEVIRTKSIIDNRRCLAACKKVICKL